MIIRKLLLDLRQHLSSHSGCNCGRCSTSNNLRDRIEKALEAIDKMPEAQRVPLMDASLWDAYDKAVAEEKG